MHYHYSEYRSLSLLRGQLVLYSLVRVYNYEALQPKEQIHQKAQKLRLMLFRHFCTVQYIFENMPADQKPETSGQLNVAILAVAADNPEMDLPITLITGYISTKCVIPEAKEKVATELVQDHNDLAFAKDQLATTDTGYVYAYCVR